MKNLIHLVILSMVITFSSFVYGQDESLFNRINGVKLKENIFIKWDEPKKTFVYASDGIDSWHTIDDDLIFNVRNDYKNNFKVYLQFYNPLRYSIKSEVKDIDDPAYKAINEFIS
ncbi:hypothetical protein, partial [Fluviicola sp.]|uniref:hypothetical protein n=1 Tax=Fluviicola sp. TaxID=1917219 RepID=UPI002621725B